VRPFASRILAAFLLCAGSAEGAEDLLVVPGVAGKPGGRLVSAERTEPKTLNPIFANDAPSKNLIQRMMADLVHINRHSQKTEPALAKSIRVSPDGLRYDVELRQGLQFSDGYAFDADDVIFTFQVVLDESVNSPQRGLWIYDGKPVKVKKLSPYRVLFELPRVNAVGDRMFDSVPILPRHLLEKPYRDGKLKETWGVRTPAGQIAGLGPFRLKEFVPGQRVVLERNPYYWKKDATGNRLPYVNELVYTFAASEDMQVMRFQSGESDVISRIAPKDASVLERDAARRAFAIQDAGPGFEYSLLFFNLNDTAPPRAPWRKSGFRRAVAVSIDRPAIIKLVYGGHGTPLATPVAAGNKLWINSKLPPLTRNVEAARKLFSAEGFRWAPDGSLLDDSGQRVQFTILASSGNPERVQMATLIQADLKQVGISVDVVPMEFRSLVTRVNEARQFDVALMALASADADPNVDINLWQSQGNQHAWNPLQQKPATAWEAEIDGLMQKVLVTRKYEERKALFDRMQQIAMDQMPVIPLVSPNILVGGRKALGNFQPALLEPYALWNADQLYWHGAGSGSRQ
jgi:peptide/nickel transport system substrate-binding protein